jgi:hypothetical protein
LKIITDNRIKEISLIFDLTDLFEMDKEKSEIMKALTDARKEGEGIQIEDEPGRTTNLR